MYIVRDWKRISLLLALKRVVEDGTSKNPTTLIVSVAHAHDSLSNETIKEGLITFGADVVFVFQDAKSNVIVQLINNHAPFMVGVHCMAYQTNLVVQTLSDFEVVKYVEDLLASLYSSFNFSPKLTLEFQ